MNWVAGIFVGDDDVIVGAAPAQARDQIIRKGLAETFILTRFQSHFDLAQDIEQAIGCLADAADVHAIAAISHLVLAISGPLRATGPAPSTGRRRSGSPDGSFGTLIRPSYFQGVDAHHELTKARKRRAHLALARTLCLLQHDAAAYAYGDYGARRNAFMAQGGSGAVFDATEKYVLLILDEGVGGAIIAGGALDKGPIHAEMGHVLVHRHPDDQGFEAQCAAHRRDGCLESLVGLPALRARWGDDLLSREDDGYAAWAADDPRLWLIAYYVAQLLCTLTLIVAPTRVALAGRTATTNPHLVKMIRGCQRDMMTIRTGDGRVFPGYERQQDDAFIDIVLDQDHGVLGAVLLAADAESVQTKTKRAQFSRLV